jgi:hypothetical protein
MEPLYLHGPRPLSCEERGEFFRWRPLSAPEMMSTQSIFAPRSGLGGEVFLEIQSGFGLGW